MEEILLRLTIEVRHALHSMLGFMELARGEPLSERQEHCLAECRSVADQLLQLANDASELAHPEALREARSTFEAAAAIFEVAEIERARAERKGLAFDYSLSE